MEAFRFFNDPERLARNAGSELVGHEQSKPYDPEATVEFDPIERPLTIAEEELTRTINPDQIILEGFKHMGEGYGMGC